jgi:hypothetical protein
VQSEANISPFTGAKHWLLSDHACRVPAGAALPHRHQARLSADPQEVTTRDRLVVGHGKALLYLPPSAVFTVGSRCSTTGTKSGCPMERLGGSGLERCGSVRIGRKVVSWSKSVKAFGDLFYRVLSQHFICFQAIFSGCFGG